MNSIVSFYVSPMRIVSLKDSFRLTIFSVFLLDLFAVVIVIVAVVIVIVISSVYDIIASATQCCDRIYYNLNTAYSTQRIVLRFMETENCVAKRD